MSTLAVVALNTEYALATLGPVLIQLWERGTPTDGARAACAAAARLAKSPHARTGTLIIVRPHAALPGPEARSLLSELPAMLGRGAGVALVREGEGFRSAAIRAVMTGIMMMARDPVPHEVFSNTDQGIGWLTPRLRSPTPLGLAAAVADLRAQVAGS